MIQKAIVESIENNYQVKVRIPKYDKMSTDGVSHNDLSTSIICSYPGTKVSYGVGDVVIVGFENDEISKPVILGLLYADRDNNAEVKVDGVTDALSQVESVIDDISNKTNYIHIKYSNDGGNTFTSLFDYSENSFINGTYYRDNISINKLSSFISWDINDLNHNVSKDKFTYKIIIRTSSGKELISTDYYTEIPDTYKYEDSVSISYEITPNNDADMNDYIISLYTDRDEIGTLEGDYIGIYYSNSSVPPLVSSDYSWLSIKTRIQKFIDEVNDSLLSRVQVNERYLFGQSKEDLVTTDTGISSAVNVEKDKLDVSKKSIIQLSDKILVDTKQHTLSLGNVRLTVLEDGGLIIS